MGVHAELPLQIQPQPSDRTCGPTCLHAVYRYYQDDISLEQVVAEVPSLAGGGTLAVWLGNHALSRGYKATIYIYNLQLFDPTWFQPDAPDLRGRLMEQLRHKSVPKLHEDTQACLQFLDKGGEFRMEDLTAGLIRRYLTRSVPILTGLSSTYLYRCPREFGPHDDYDDIRGEASGHFVVLCGYSSKERTVLVADPLLPNPVSSTSRYAVKIDRLISSILLGILTYDGNLLIVEPRKRRSIDPHGDSDRRK